MKQISAILAAGTILFFTSCNNSGKEKEETKATDTVAAKTTVAEPVFTPFTVFMVQHKVKNFDKWKPYFLADDSLRQAYGLTEYVLARGLEDSNLVIVINKAAEVQKAKEFSKLPGLKKIMQKAGVISAPIFDYAEVIRNDDSPTDIKERMMVIHHVKDFNAWLKIFDAEGKETRASYGLIDRGLARGVEDSNMVYVVFAISDMAKAKARGNSPELKKLMTDAGVDSKPKMILYRRVD